MVPERKRKVDPIPDNLQVMFDNIFAVDPRTGLPSCDISVFLSENTSPEVKQFISMNLFRDSLGSDDTNVVDGIDEDTVALLTRGASESSSAYRDRVLTYLKNERKALDSSRSNK